MTVFTMGEADGDPLDSSDDGGLLQWFERLARRFGDPDPQNLAAQSMLQWLRSIANAKDDEERRSRSRAPYRYAIVRNRSIKEAVKRQQLPTVPESNLRSSEDGAPLESIAGGADHHHGSDLDNRAMAGEVLAAIPSPKKLFVIWMRSVEEMSFAEIGKRLGIKENAACLCFHQTRDALRARLAHLDRAIHKDGAGDRTYGGGAPSLIVHDQAGTARPLRVVGTNVHLDRDGFLCGGLDLSMETGVNLARQASFGWLTVRLDNGDLLPSAPFALEWSGDRADLAAFVGGEATGLVSADRLEIELFHNAT